MSPSLTDQWLDAVRGRLFQALDGAWQDPSYAGGAAGQLLCLTVLEAQAQQRGASRGLSQDWVEAQVARMLSQIWRQPHSLFQGMEGVLLAIQELGRVYALEGFADDIDDADTLLLEALLHQRDLPEHFDLISGISGLLVYAVHRECHGGRQPLVRACLQRLAAMVHREGEALSWFTPPAWIRGFPMGDANPLGCTDLGVAHGQAGVLGALALAAHASAPNRAQALSLMRGSLVYLRRHEQQGCDWHFASAAEMPGASRCAWCYGDLGMAAALRLAAVAEDDAELDRWAERLLEGLQRRSRLQLGFVDAWLCHGSLGSAWMLEQLAPGMRGQLIEECLRFKPLDELLDEVLHSAMAPLGLLEGHAGVAASLVEARGFVAPLEWSLPLLAGRRALRLMSLPELQAA